LKAKIEVQIGVLPKMSPASSEVSASFTRNGFCGAIRNSRIVGLATRKMNHENSRGPRRICRSKRRRAAAA
jgi:hypothetical protein